MIEQCNGFAAVFARGFEEGPDQTFELDRANPALALKDETNTSNEAAAQGVLTQRPAWVACLQEVAATSLVPEHNSLERIPSGSAC